MNADNIIHSLRLVHQDFEGRSTFQVRGAGGKTYAFFPTSITDNIPPLRPELSRAICLLSALHLGHAVDATLGVGEEDRGAMIISDMLLYHELPRTLARWTPSGGPGEIAVPLSNEYIEEGQTRIYLNGVRPDDRVIVVDDLISTGGTMVALVEAVRRTGAEILELFAVGEKTENRGRQKIQRETGLRIKTLVATDLVTQNGDPRSRVLRFNLGHLSRALFQKVAAAFPRGLCHLGSGESA